MGRNVPHYVVVWDLQWQIIECRRLDGGCDLRGQLADKLAQLVRDGWWPESGAQFGFAFVTRADERRLVTITARDPHSCAAQSFSPFGK
ncbi:MAG: hypothetical protein ABJC66_11625 [Gammaproteobacteria bacterium]